MSPSEYLARSWGPIEAELFDRAIRMVNELRKNELDYLAEQIARRSGLVK